MRRLILLVAAVGLLALPLSANAASIYLEFTGAGCTSFTATTCTASPSATGIALNLVFDTSSPQAPGVTAGTAGWEMSVEWDRPGDVGAFALLDNVAYAEIKTPPVNPSSAGLVSFTDSADGVTGEAYGFQAAGITSISGGPTLTIGTLTFDAVGLTGVSTIYAGLFNQPNDTVGDGNGIGYTPSFGSAVVTLIPEPSTAALLGLGLFGLVAAGRRSRK